MPPPRRKSSSYSRAAMPTAARLAARHGFEDRQGLVARNAVSVRVRESFAGCRHRRSSRCKRKTACPVPAQLFLPRTKRASAALIFVHGGPPRQMFPAFHFSEYYARTYAFNRRLAELGYVVLSVNYRSGVGYGRGFREAENRGWNGRVRVPRRRRGWSLARKTTRCRPEPNRHLGRLVRRAAHGAGLGSQFGPVRRRRVPPFRRFRLELALAAGISPEPIGLLRCFRADARARVASSPLAAMDQWRSPVLLFSGDMDANVDVAETVDLTQKLRARSVDVRTDPGAGRGAWLRPARHLAKAVAGDDRLFRRKASGSGRETRGHPEQHSQPSLKAFLA